MPHCKVCDKYHVIHVYTEITLHTHTQKYHSHTVQKHEKYHIIDVDTNTMCTVYMHTEYCFTHVHTEMLHCTNASKIPLHTSAKRNNALYTCTHKYRFMYSTQAQHITLWILF